MRSTALQLVGHVAIDDVSILIARLQPSCTVDHCVLPVYVRFSLHGVHTLSRSKPVSGSLGRRLFSDLGAHFGKVGL